MVFFLFKLFVVAINRVFIILATLIDTNIQRIFQQLNIDNKKI